MVETFRLTSIQIIFSCFLKFQKCSDNFRIGKLFIGKNVGAIKEKAYYYVL